jgi:hypothetical protein
MITFVSDHSKEEMHLKDLYEFVRVLFIQIAICITSSMGHRIQEEILQYFYLNVINGFV